jgi:hypothetical protein
MCTGKLRLLPELRLLSLFEILESILRKWIGNFDISMHRSTLE